MNKDFSGLSKLQCFGQNACGGGCTPCFPCAPCPPACIVSKTVTRVVNSVPAPAPTPLPTAEYGYVFNDGPQTVAAAAGVSFSTNGVLSAGVTHTAGGNAVVLADAGTYAVWFTVMGTAANQFILYLNDTSVPGTFYGTETGAAGSAVRTLTTGFAIVTAPAGSTLALVNSTGATVTLATGVGGGGPNVNASMMVVKLA